MNTTMPGDFIPAGLIPFMNSTVLPMNGNVVSENASVRNETFVPSGVEKNATEAPSGEA